MENNGNVNCVWGGILNHIIYCWASLVNQMIQNPPAMWETWARSLGWEDPLDKEMATHPSILAWRITMDRGSWGGGGCSLWDHKESDMTEGLKLFSRRWTWKVLHFPFHKEIKNGQNRQSLSGSMTRPAWTASITKDSKIKSLPQWRGCNDSYGWSMLMYGRN